MTTLGPVEVERTLYKDRTDPEARTVAALEARLGVVGGFWMPSAAKQAAWVVSQMTPGVSEELFTRVGTMQPSKSSLDRLSKEIGGRWEEDRKAPDNASGRPTSLRPNARQPSLRHTSTFPRTCCRSQSHFGAISTPTALQLWSPIRSRLSRAMLSVTFMLVLFDIDDTLMDDSGATSDAVAALHAHVASPLQLAEFQQRWRHALELHFGRYLAGEVSFQQQRRDRIRDALQQTLPECDADALFEHYLTTYSASWRPFDDVTPCLAHLSRVHTLGVVSNGNSTQQRSKLKQVGLLDMFSLVVVSDDIGVAKPAPAIFNHAMRLASAAPADTIYVGDHPHNDALAATRVGARGVWLNRKQLVTPAPPGVEAIATLTELPRCCDAT